MQDVIINKIYKIKIMYIYKVFIFQDFLEFNKTTVTMLMWKIQKLFQYVVPFQLIFYL